MIFYLSLKNITRKTILFITILFTLAAPVFSQEKNLGVVTRNNKPEELTQLQDQARLYRQQGQKAKEMGELDEAVNFFQKAIVLDSSYAACYNDLGILYEAKGLIERAEECYLRCIKIDPNYLSAYSNLALVYENMRELRKALFYWEKRVDLGSANDPWTEKARARIKDIRLVLAKEPLDDTDTREREVFSLMKDVVKEKALLKQDDKTLSARHFEKAKQRYDNGDFAEARKEALDAQQLNPTNEEIEKFIEKVQRRALSR